MVVFLCFCCGIGGSFVMVLICANLNNSYLVYLRAQLTSASLSPRLVKSDFKLTTSPPGNSSLCSVAVLKVLHASLDPLWWWHLTEPSSGAANPRAALEPQKLIFCGKLEEPPIEILIWVARKALAKFTACSDGCPMFVWGLNFFDFDSLNGLPLKLWYGQLGLVFEANPLFFSIGR